MTTCSVPITTLVKAPYFIDYTEAVMVKVSATNRKGTSQAIPGQGAVLPRAPVLNPDVPAL